MTTIRECGCGAVLVLLAVAACGDSEGLAPAAEPGAGAPRGSESVASGLTSVVGDVAGLALELEAPDHPLSLHGFEGIRAFLVNEGDEPVTVVLPGDGSEMGWRSPVVRWDPPWRVYARCGNMNVPGPDDLRLLGRGERVELGWLGRPTFDEAGTYEVALELEHLPDLGWKDAFVGPLSAEIIERVRRIAPYRLRSNAVAVRVVE